MCRRGRPHVALVAVVAVGGVRVGLQGYRMEPHQPAHVSRWQRRVAWSQSQAARVCATGRVVVGLLAVFMYSCMPAVFLRVLPPPPRFPFRNGLTDCCDGEDSHSLEYQQTDSRTDCCPSTAE